MRGLAKVGRGLLAYGQADSRQQSSRYSSSAGAGGRVTVDPRAVLTEKDLTALYSYHYLIAGGVRPNRRLDCPVVVHVAAGVVATAVRIHTQPAAEICQIGGHPPLHEGGGGPLSGKSQQLAGC